MPWKPRKRKWNWRKFLTAEEIEVLKRADEAKAAWLTLNKNRAAITNRAIQRAKYASLSSA
jgi:glutathione peroxidase-family protein